MRFKKPTRPLLPGVRRLLDGALHYAAALADAHPLVVSIAPRREQHAERD